MIIFIVFGASGDLAKRKTFPALVSLIKHRNIPSNSIKILGYSRSVLSNEEFVSRFELQKNFTDPVLIEELSSSIFYFQGTYNDPVDFVNFHQFIKTTFNPNVEIDQLVCYLALPPAVFLNTSTNIHFAFKGFKNIKLVIEKPFGTNAHTSMELSSSLSTIFRENQIFRIDHYLGKEMIKNIFILRFCNHFFGAIWNHYHVSNVQITFKETLGVEGRGNYFDSSGILRDIFQNHLIQILSIIAMEPPLSLDSNAIRNEKVKLLKCIDKNILQEQCVFGQYEGYLNEPEINPTSHTPTFASVALSIENERWTGVPFILKCGKGMNESKVEIRIQLKDTPASIRYFQNEEEIMRNELVIRIQPKEAIYLKLTLKKPGTFDYKTEIAELDLSYASRFKDFRIPDAYESLILDIINNDPSSFVRDDELKEAWEITDQIIKYNESPQATVPLSYKKGSRGPFASDELIKNVGKYCRSSKEYIWPKL